MATLNINTNKDSEIREAQATTNYGNSTSFIINYSTSGYHRRSLIGFDISSAPTSSLVTNVTLGIYVSTGTESTVSDFERITGVWTELGVTWNNQPVCTSTNKYNYSTGSGVGLKQFNITNLYKDAKTAGNILGIRINPTSGTGHQYFRSKDYGSNIPYICITYTLSDHYYIKTSGSDTLDGQSWANAWATVNKGATTVPDGKTLHIEHGTYNAEPVGNKIAPQNAGASGIKYQVHTTGGGTGAATVTVEKN